jgi:hypothetical protein
MNGADATLILIVCYLGLQDPQAAQGVENEASNSDIRSNIA